MKVKGYACHYNKPNANGQIVDEKSFEAVLKARKADGVNIPINYQHNSPVMIGKINNFYSDSEGLFIEGEIFDDMAIVKEFVSPLIKNGVIERFSTEGYIRKADMERRENNTYYARNFELTAVAVVNLPADKDAVMSYNSARFDAFEEEEEPKKEKKSSAFLII